MDVKETSNVVSIERITVAGKFEEIVSVEEVKRHDEAPAEAGDAQDKYVEGRIVRHENDGRRTKYPVKRYDYGPAKNIYKPFRHVPQHFIRHYYERRRPAKQQSPQVNDRK